MVGVGGGGGRGENVLLEVSCWLVGKMLQFTNCDHLWLEENAVGTSRMWHEGNQRCMDDLISRLFKSARRGE